jgi:uncharacterized membrane protein
MYDIESYHKYHLDEYGTTYEEIKRIQFLKNQCQEIINYFLNEKGSIRQCEKETLIPKSTIHRIIHTYIKFNYDEEYKQIVIILRYNKSNRCKSRKYWTGRAF